MTKNSESSQLVPSALRKAPLYLSLLFLAFFLTGIALDEPDRILEQAMQICLSCIGVG